MAGSVLDSGDIVMSKYMLSQPSTGKPGTKPSEGMRAKVSLDGSFVTLIGWEEGGVVLWGSAGN